MVITEEQGGERTETWWCIWKLGLLTIRANYIWFEVEEWEKKSSSECSSGQRSWQAGICGHASRSMDSRSRSHGRDISVHFESCSFG